MVGARRRGYEPAERRLALTVGSEVTAELVLRALPSRGAPRISLSPEPETRPLAAPTERGEPAAGPPAWSPWVALGVAVVASGAGAYFGSRVLDTDRSEAEADSSATGATVSFTVAGVAAASGVGLWIWRQ